LIRVVEDAHGLTVGTVIDRTQLGAATLPDGIYIVRDENGVHLAMFLPDPSSIQGVCTLSPCDIEGFTADMYGNDGTQCSSNNKYVPSDKQLQSFSQPLLAPPDFYVNSALVTRVVDNAGTAHKGLLYGTGAGEHRDMISYYTYSTGQCTPGSFPYNADSAPLAFFDLTIFTPPFSVVSVVAPTS
jgi:hypothetical protein